MLNLTGKIVVITGSSRGFGLEMALAVIAGGRKGSDQRSQSAGG